MTYSLSAGRRLVIPAIIAAVVFIADQLTKLWVLRTWPQPYTGEIPIIANWLELTYIRNTGVAFGMFEGVPQLFTFTSLLIVGAAIWLYLKHVQEASPWLAVCLGLIVGGAIGNVVDRIRFGYVVDFIKTFDGRFPVFNIADSCIVVGVLLMAVYFMYNEERVPQSRLAPTIEADDGR
ncbi:MAG: signal peptidase II [Chloroflexota bacterium]|nr:signal peptidase II [Chloroflexota bacterium]